MEKGEKIHSKKKKEIHEMNINYWIEKNKNLNMCAWCVGCLSKASFLGLISNFPWFLWVKDTDEIKL